MKRRQRSSNFLSLIGKFSWFVDFGRIVGFLTGCWWLILNDFNVHVIWCLVDGWEISGGSLVGWWLICWFVVLTGILLQLLLSGGSFFQHVVNFLFNLANIFRTGWSHQLVCFCFSATFWLGSLSLLNLGSRIWYCTQDAIVVKKVFQREKHTLDHIKSALTSKWPRCDL